MNKGIFAFFSAAAISVFLTAASIDVNAVWSGMPEDEKIGRVVLIVADYLNIGDINRLEKLRSLDEGCYLALMNNRQPGKAGAVKSKLIIGSGKRLEISTDMTSGGSEESFRALYRMEGGRVTKHGSLVFTDIYKLHKRNSESEYVKYIGYLGKSIKKNNGVTCHIGNSDTEAADRSSMLIAMDGNGEIDLGETESTTREDGSFPYGKRTDYNKLAELYKQYLPASSFIVVDTGDMARLEAFRDHMSEAAYENCREDVLNDIGSFVENVVRYGGFKTLILVSTYPSKADVESGNRLTPVAVYEASGKGVLYSASTRREGIILNTDLADYILQKLGYADSSAITQVSRKEAGAFLEIMNSNIIQTSVLRLPVLTFYSIMMIAAIFLLFMTVVFFSKEFSARYYQLSCLTAYTMLAFPLVLLFISTSTAGSSPAVYLAYSTAAALAFSSLLHIYIKEKIRVLLTISTLQLTALTFDIVLGSTFMKQSVLGYDPIIGARFYGIGNEYAGIFIGCSMIVFGCLLEILGRRFNKCITAAYFIFCLFILGQPMLGANFGGAAAGAAGYILAFFLLYGIEFSKRNALLGILALCGSAALFFIADLTGIGTPSHLGSLVRETEENGIGVIISTIQRKISMNLRLIRYTIWTKVLICMIAAISVMFYRPVKLLKRVFGRFGYLKVSWICVAASTVVGFAVNDSGIVLAATAMIYVVFTMLLICIGERNES